MEVGLHFPLHPRISEVLNNWKLRLTQMNVFSMEQPDHIPSIDEVLSLTNLAATNDQGCGWFYVRARAKNKIVEDVSNKVDRWKNRCWWVFGDWRSPVDEFGSFDRIEILIEFGFHHGMLKNLFHTS